jgi:hypothetical protein
VTTTLLPFGEITTPSGTLEIFDVGVTALVRAGQVPEIPRVVVSGLPRDRPLVVLAASITDGEWAACLDHVVVRVGNAAVARTEHAGDVVVDFARVLFIDGAARSQWNHDGSIDGCADYVFWGRDAPALAAVVDAPALPDEPGVFGWVNAPVDEIVAHAQRAAAACATRGLKVAGDFRPHSHHWRALVALRRSAHGAGVVDVGGARACLWMTSWGDGIFPVLLDLAEDGALVQVRVQLFSGGADGSTEHAAPTG